MWVCQPQWEHVHLALILNLTPEKELELDSGHTHSRWSSSRWILENWMTQLFLFWFFSSLQSFPGSPQELSLHILPSEPAGWSHLHFTAAFYWAGTVSAQELPEQLALRDPVSCLQGQGAVDADSFHSLCVIRANTALLRSEGPGLQGWCQLWLSQLELLSVQVVLHQHSA